MSDPSPPQQNISSQLLPTLSSASSSQTLSAESPNLLEATAAASSDALQPSGQSQHSQQVSQSQHSQPTSQRLPRTPVNPSNPLKRKLSENMEALIAQAKASKTAPTNDAKTAQTETIYDKLERELTCSICCELFKDPVTILKCLHNFCGSCVVPWCENNSSCPSCRSPMRECRDAFALKPLLDMLVKEKPELAHSMETTEEAQKVYKPGQKIDIGVNDDSFSDFIAEDDDMEAQPEIWQPCRCCPTSENPLPVYTCPDPIIVDDPNTDFSLTFKHHQRCHQCDKETPYDPDVAALKCTHCAGCARSYCGILFGGCVQDVPPQEPFLMSLEDCSLYNPNSTIWFNNNFFERDAFNRFVNSEANPHTWESLGKDMKDWLFRKYDNSIPWAAAPSPITRDSYICPYCTTSIFDHYLLDFLISERNSLGWTDIRTKCWYGKNCRTQRHNADHCARLNHICDETPQEERGQYNRPPRPAPADGNQIRPDTVTGPVRSVGPPSIGNSNLVVSPSQPGDVDGAAADGASSFAAIPDDDPQPSS